MKERFTDAEWSQLEHLPPLVFQFVALVDADLGVEEAGRFAAELADAAHYRDPLMRELFSDLSQHSTFERAFSEMSRISSTSAEAIRREIGEIRTLLQAKLSREEYHRFMASIIFFGKMIAESAGGQPEKKGIFHKKKEVPAASPQEIAALAILAQDFGVDLEAGMAAVARL